MPYISNSEKEKSNEGIYNDAGSLNYSIHQLVSKYIEQNKESYQTYNDIIGVLDCVKMELYRRLISDYEHRKLLQNGDVDPYKK